MSFVSNLFFMMRMLSFGGFIKPVCYLYIAFLWFFGSDRILSSEVVYFSNETFYQSKLIYLLVWFHVKNASFLIRK